MRDTINNSYTVKLLSENVSATGWSNYIDLKGLQGCKIILTAEMDTASPGNQLLATLQESDTDPTTPGSTASYSAVAAADYIAGQSPFAALVDTTTYCQEMGYIGSQRHIAVKLTETGTAAGEVHIVAVAEYPENAPLTTAPTSGTVT